MNTLLYITVSTEHMLYMIHSIGTTAIVVGIIFIQRDHFVFNSQSDDNAVLNGDMQSNLQTFLLPSYLNLACYNYYHKKQR